jgi:hypothetical protein
MHGLLGRTLAAAAGLAAAVALPLVPDLQGVAIQEPWWYGSTHGSTLGPADWKKQFPACGQPRQSPINLGQARPVFARPIPEDTRLCGLGAMNC